MRGRNLILATRSPGRLVTAQHRTCRWTQNCGPLPLPFGSAGYIVAYELARSNHALGMTVVADCVNPRLVTREAWRAVATSTSSGLLEVEIVCSDPAEHRRRVERRKAAIPEHTLPTWEAALRHDYEAWTTSRVVIDSALVSASEAANLILERTSEQRQNAANCRPSS